MKTAEIAFNNSFLDKNFATVKCLDERTFARKSLEIFTIPNILAQLRRIFSRICGRVDCFRYQKEGKCDHSLFLNARRSEETDRRKKLIDIFSV